MGKSEDRPWAAVVAAVALASAEAAVARAREAARAQYLERVLSWNRRDLLATARRGGISAHRLTTAQVAEMLWQRFGYPAFQRARRW